MITIEQFTPEIKAKIPQYIERALEGVFDGGRFKNFNYDIAKKAVDHIYKLCNYDAPEVIVAENPSEAHKIYYDLLDAEGVEYKRRSHVDMYLFALNVYSDSYYTYYKFIKDEFKIETTGIVNDLDYLYDLQKNSGVYSAIFLHDVCIVSKYPMKIYRDDENRLHKTDGVAVEWNASSEETKWDCYFIHGRNVPKDFYLKVLNGNYTKEDFFAETNEELKAAAYEILGQERFLTMMEAKMIDDGTFVHANGELETVELYKTDFTLPETDDNPLMWVKFICPSTGSSYFIDVEPIYSSAVDAAISTSPFYGAGIDSPDDYKFDQRT